MTPGLHLVSDFDGVWTEPAAEAEAVHQTLVEDLSRLSGVEPGTVQSEMESYAAEVMAEPERYGWKIGERISSYVDEDYFCVPAALGQYLEHADGSLPQRFRESILGEWDDVTTFLDHCFHSTCQRFRDTVDHDLTRGAEPVLRWLLERDVQVTFVTNAPAEKVMDWFAHHDLAVANARETRPDAAPLRVYGRAGKQWLGESGRTLDFQGRAVHVDRPDYRAILERESPDLVVGDVLSLDLALPIAMKEEGHPSAPRETALLWRRETPDWVLRSVGVAGRIDHLIAHVTALPRLILGLEHAGRAAAAAR